LPSSTVAEWDGDRAADLPITVDKLL